MSIDNILDSLNASCLSPFSYSCTFLPADSSPSFTLSTIPLDPIRHEGAAPGNMIIRWAAKADFLAAGYLPVQGAGDKLLIEDGDTYIVQQVQADSGRGYRLILEKVEAT